MNWPPRRLAPAVLVAAGIAAYADSFSGGFVFDDVPSIPDNPTIRHLARLGEVLRPPAGGGLTVDGRPVLNLSLAVNYAIGGTGAWGYHALNLAIHILAALTLFGIVRRTLGRAGGRPDPRAAGPDLMALAVAMLWLLHPLQTAAVTYVIQRAESLMGLFYLLTLYAFVRHADKPGRGGWGAAAVACCLLGMATKETMATAPLIVFLYDRTFVSGTFRGAWKRHRGLHLGLASTWIALAALMAGTGARGGSVGFGSGVPWTAYALTQAGAVAHYLRLCLWPRPLVFDYGTALAAGPGAVAPQLATVAVLFAATAAALVSRPRLGFLGAWFFGILAPTSSVIPVATEPIAEHRMYLPLAAVAAFAVAAAQRAGGRRAVAGLVALALGLGLLTALRNRDYRSELSIWSRTAEDRPGSWRAQNNLALALAGDPSRLPEAIAHYREAVRLEPDSAEVRNNLGVALAALPGGRAEAIRQYREAIRLKPDYAEAENNLGNALSEIPGRLPEAIEHYREAIRLKPGYANAHCDLAQALARGPGGRGEAVDEYHRTLLLDPDNAEAHAGLALALAQTPGRTDEAIAQFRQAIRLRPGYPEAHNGLGALLAAMPGRLPEAVAEYEEAVRLKPDYAEARYNLALALAGEPGRRGEAIAQLREAIRLRPGYPEAHNNLAVVLAQEPDGLPEAIAEYGRAIRLRPDYAEARNNLAIALAQTPGRLDEAIAQFRQAIRLEPGYAAAHNNLGNVLGEIPGRLPEAVAEYEEAVRLKPDYADARVNLAAAYAALGRVGDAISQLEQALRIDPDLAAAREGLDRLRSQAR